MKEREKKKKIRGEIRNDGRTREARVGYVYKIIERTEFWSRFRRKTRLMFGINIT